MLNAPSASRGTAFALFLKLQTGWAATNASWPNVECRRHVCKLLPLLAQWRGSLLITEWVLLATILIIGLLPMLIASRVDMTQTRFENSLENCSDLTDFSYPS